MCDLRIPINYRLQDLSIFMHFSCNLGQDTPENVEGQPAPLRTLRYTWQHLKDTPDFFLFVGKKRYTCHTPGYTCHPQDTPGDTWPPLKIGGYTQGEYFLAPPENRTSCTYVSGPILILLLISIDLAFPKRYVTPSQLYCLRNGSWSNLKVG